MVETLTIGSDIIQNLPPEASIGIMNLVTIFKAVGLIFIIYFILQIVNIILNIKRNKRIKRIEKKVDQVDYKVNKILSKKKSNNKGKKKE